MRRCAAIPIAVALAGAALEASGQTHSVLDPASAQARELALLSWWMFGIGAVVLIGVTALLLIAITRARADTPAHVPTYERRRNLVIVGGVLLPLVTAGALLVWTIVLGPQSSAAAAPADALDVEIVAHRWWWEIHYLNDGGQRIATVANELHVPVGRAVRVQLKSEDVIHSFWVPNLHGKTDMIPGRTTTSWFTVEREGEFSGRCAEFCGVQHAAMGFLVVAQTPAAFTAWLERQAASAREPGDELARRGMQVFSEHACVMCHTIRGTTAQATVAPDLTHVASRRTLAAGRLPNNGGTLAAWILDPQQIKPGALMPPTRLGTDDMNALLHYLGGLE